MNPFGHVDLRVSDIDAALEFYGALLPAFGFTERYDGETWKVWSTTEPLPVTAYFGITQAREHVANDHRIALWLGSPAEVDRLAEISSRRAL